MNRIVLFPIDRESVAIVRYAKQLGDVEVIPLLPPSLKILDGKDIGIMDGGEFVNIKFSTEYEKEILHATKVIFLDSRSVIEEKIYFELIEIAKNNNIDVFIKESLKNRLSTHSSKNAPVFKHIQNKEELISFDIPIISIFSYGKYCNHLEVELTIREFFIRKGYTVTQIGNKLSSEIYGYTSLPEFLNDNHIDIEKKIIQFNRYVYNLANQEKTDIIILSIEEPIMKYNNQILNGLGIIPFIVQSAIQSDVAIVNLYQNNYSKEYFEQLKLYCKYKLGVEPKYFCLANTQVMKNNDDPSILDFLFLDREYVISNINNNFFAEDNFIFNVFDDVGREKVYEHILEDLSSNTYQV